MSSELLAALPQSLRDYYDLDALFAADVDGQLRWVIRQGATWYFGSLIGEAFADAIDSTWPVVNPQSHEYWT